jgi:hypothetical protein
MAIESKMRRPAMFGGSDLSGPPKRSAASLAAMALVALLVVAAAAWGWNWWKSRPASGDVVAGLQEGGRSDVEVGEGEYQAVFLDNGQTYFGKLSRKGDFYRLSNVYYIDFRQNPQDPAASAADMKLVKLGGEVHGPEDFMDINKDHVLFIEDLSEESKVAKAIAEYDVTKKSQ